MTAENEEGEFEEGFYWVDCGGPIEILFRKTGHGSESEGHWYRPGEEAPVPPSEISFIYPGRLRAPAWRIDNSVEEEMEAPSPVVEIPKDPATNLACFDCDLEYPFEGHDLFLSDDDWAQIAPFPDGGGFLCPNCISIRLAKWDRLGYLKGTFDRGDSLEAFVQVTPPFDATPDDEL